MTTRFDSAVASVLVERRPPAPALQAFDGADRFLLAEFAALAALAALDPASGGTVLIVNDAFGALAVALAAAGIHRVTSWSDSVSAQHALATNLRLNDLDVGAVTVAAMSEPPPAGASVVLLRVPKSLDLLRWQLRQLANVLDDGVPIIGAGMVKHLSPNARQVFADELGNAEGSRTEFRARCITSVCRRDPGGDVPGELADTPAFTSPARHRIAGHPGVFGSGALDHGTALLLQHLPDLAPGEHVVDLGCGTGVVGLTVASLRDDILVTFVDESLLAIATTRENWATAYGSRPARFVADDHLLPDHVEGHPVDHVVCNPPFHQSHTVGDSVALQMFDHAHDLLRPGGTLTVVGNRHLGYHIALRRVFGNVDVVGSSPKFVVLRTARHGA